MNIAVIPARGGSKRIPRKNVREFCGRPIIAWPIETARESRLFDHVVVSTDDAEIAAIAKQWGAEVPFTRPAELSDDHVGITAVISHSTQWALDRGWPVNAVCCIYATAALLRPDDLRDGLRALESDHWAYALSATTFAAPIQRSFRVHPDGGIEMFDPEHFTTRSQDLPVAFHDAAQFCWGRADAWIQGVRIFDRRTIPVILPRWRVQDIDEPDDWIRAEVVFECLKTDARR